MHCNQKPKGRELAGLRKESTIATDTKPPDALAEKGYVYYDALTSALSLNQENSIPVSIVGISVGRDCPVLGITIQKRPIVLENRRETGITGQNYI